MTQGAEPPEPLPDGLQLAAEQAIVLYYSISYYSIAG